jgi:hypothetical protein
MSAAIADDLMAEIEGFDAEKATNVEKLQIAKAAMELAVDLTAEVADATDDDHAKAYFVDHLKILTTRDHGFLSRDFNIDEWIAQLERSEEEE